MGGRWTRAWPVMGAGLGALFLGLAVMWPHTVAGAAYPGENGLIAYAERFETPDGGSYTEVYVAYADSFTPVRRTNDGGVFIGERIDSEGSRAPLHTWSGHPRWTPDGSLLSFMHQAPDGTRQIRIVDPSWGDPEVLFPDWAGTMISWSPDGRRIAYGDAAGLWIADSDGTNAMVIAEPRVGLPPMGPDHVAEIDEVRWSPDGATIAYDEWSGGGLVAGTDHLVLIDASPPHARTYIDSPGLSRLSFDWSPDGQALVMGGGSSDGLAVLDVRSGTAEALTSDSGESPIWAPDGTLVVSARDGELWLTDPSTGLSRSTIMQFSDLLPSAGLDWQPDVRIDQPIGAVDPRKGHWRIVGDFGRAIPFYYGDPGDHPFMGDWDCDGVATPGLFRRSDAFAYLRNSNTQGIADIRFFFGDPSDVPLAGDFDGDGCDTVSIYRPDEARFFIINELGRDDGGLGAAEYSFLFGDVGDKPVVGDWDGDGVDEIGLHREATGLFYWRNTLDTGNADGAIYFGDPGDRFVAGDWGPPDGRDTPAVFRPHERRFYFRYSLTQGIADDSVLWGHPAWVPVPSPY